MCDFFHSIGLPVILHSDGNIEVTAGMDIVKIHKEYRKDLAFMGGIDKRELAKDKTAIEEELRRKVIPIFKKGGYIPALDHTVPPNIPLENFLYYLELKRKIAEGEWS